MPQTHCRFTVTGLYCLSASFSLSFSFFLYLVICCNLLLPFCSKHAMWCWPCVKNSREPKGGCVDVGRVHCAWAEEFVVLVWCVQWNPLYQVGEEWVGNQEDPGWGPNLANCGVLRKYWFHWVLWLMMNWSCEINVSISNSYGYCIIVERLPPQHQIHPPLGPFKKSHMHPWVIMVSHLW